MRIRSVVTAKHSLYFVMESPYPYRDDRSLLYPSD